MVDESTMTAPDGRWIEGNYGRFTPREPIISAQDQVVWQLTLTVIKYKMDVYDSIRNSNLMALGLCPSVSFYHDGMTAGMLSVGMVKWRG